MGKAGVTWNPSDAGDRSHERRDVGTLDPTTNGLFNSDDVYLVCS